MSYENVPCASPDAEREEEPAPSLYAVDGNEDNLQFVKKPIESAPSRLAETANIEDHLIMNEEEIAQATRLNRKEFESEGRDKSDEDSLENSRGMDGNNYNIQPPRTRWLNFRRWGDYTEKQSSESANTAEVPTFEFSERNERTNSVIKRAKDGPPELESGLDCRDPRGKIALDKEEYVSLQCNESIKEEKPDGRVNVNLSDPARGYYYYYNNREQENAKTTMALREREDYESDSDRGCIQEGKDGKKPQDHRAVPQGYHMQYPSIMALSQASNNMVSPQGLGNLPAHVLREHLMRLRYTTDNRHPRQHSDYASSRPEQQVPVASSPGDSAEANSGYSSLPSRHPQPVNTGIQYIDRQGLVQQGFAVIPGLGPVQVSMDGNGMYYSAIPMAAQDPNNYEKYSVAQAFAAMQSEGARLQRPHVPSVTPASEMTQHPNQDQAPNISKSYTNPQQQSAVSPTSASKEQKLAADERKLSDSPALRSRSTSPAPPPLEDSSDKKPLNVKPKGRPRPYGSRPEIKCEQCGKIFGSSSALAKHKLTHSDERRYVCAVCSKGFKRQDHLNGHMVTHRDKKPYECSFTDCDKSYCDMRSLRRHLENHHTGNQCGSGSGSGSGSRTSSPALNVSTADRPAGNTVSAVTVVPAVGHVDSATNRVVIKPSRGRPPKDKSTGFEAGDSGRSTPGSTAEAVQMRDQATMVISRKRNSDSCSSTGSEDVTHVMADKASTPLKPTIVKTEESKAHTAIDMLKQAAERVQEQREKQAAADRFQQHPYMVFQEGMSYPAQWYATQMYQGQDPRFGVYPYTQMFAPQVYSMNNGQSMIVDGQNIQRQQMANQMYAEGDSHDMSKQTAVAQIHGNLTQHSPMQEYATHNDGSSEGFYRQHGGNKMTSGTPTDATAIALATAKDTGQHLYARESYYGVHPSGTQWQQVRYDETPQLHNTTENSVSSMGNVKTAYSHVRSPDSSTSSEADERYPRGVHFAAGIGPEGFNSPGRKPQESSMARPDMKNFHHPSIDNKSQEHHKSHVENNKDDAVFRNPAEIVTPRRKRPRPEPLKIPPSVSTAFNHNRPVSPHSKSRPCSPPYTPPPMLSPRSIFSHVSATGSLTPRSLVPQMPMTPSRLLLSSRSCRSSFDGDEEQLPFPEPKINVGPQFQASIPNVIAPKENAKHDIHKATLCWYPMDERKKGKKEEVEAYLDMASSVAIVGGSSNKEYALHILHRSRGNVKDAVKLLLSKKFVTQPGDPMYNYHYEGSVKWLARERQTFRNSFRLKGKLFHNLQKEIGDTKTVGDCVEFYYLWKANHPEAVRGRTRYIDSDSEDNYEEEDTGSETNSNPSLFECDFPDCSAKFVSRQALNGHIRVHGGSFMKPSEPRKRRAPVPPLDLDRVVIKRRKPHVPAPPPQPLVEGGPLPEFACKVCGRIFHKIKSRSAHMKTHVKRPDDDEKHTVRQ